MLIISSNYEFVLQEQKNLTGNHLNCSWRAKRYYKYTNTTALLQIYKYNSCFYGDTNVQKQRERFPPFFSI
jgi:hypothetical protein